MVTKDLPRPPEFLLECVGGLSYKRDVELTRFACMWSEPEHLLKFISYPIVLL